MQSATRILYPTTAAAAFLGLSLTSHSRYSPFSLPKLHCESSSSSYFQFPSPFWRRESLAPPPPPPPPPQTAIKSTFNPLYYRQISSGSFLGLVSGLLVSRFSRTLGLAIGCLFFVVEFLASKGIHVIPYRRLQKYAAQTDLKALITENIAFKIAFGASFTLAALPDGYW